MILYSRINEMKVRCSCIQSCMPKHMHSKLYAPRYSLYVYIRIYIMFVMIQGRRHQHAVSVRHWMGKGREIYPIRDVANENFATEGLNSIKDNLVVKQVVDMWRFHAYYILSGYLCTYVY